MSGLCRFDRSCERYRKHKEGAEPEVVDSNTVKRRVKSASKQATYYRNYRRARDRALARLAQANPAQYRAFYKEERERDKQEGKEWTDIAGHTHGDSNGASDDPTADYYTAESGESDGSR